MSVDQNQKVFPVSEQEIQLAAQVLGYTPRELEKIVMEGKPLQVKWNAGRQFGRQTALDTVQRWREQVGVKVGQNNTLPFQRGTGHTLKDQMAHAARG